MRILFFGLFWFFIAFSFHLVTWKIKLPKNQIKTLLLIFTSGYFISAALMLLLPAHTQILKFQVLHNLPELAHMFIFYISIMLAYIVFYSALEVDSPSLAIIRFIDSSGRNGIDKEELYRKFISLPFLESRISTLIDDRMIASVKDGFVATSRGIILMYVISVYRYLFNMKKGG